MLYYKCVMSDYVNYKCELKNTVQLDASKKWDQHKRNMNYNGLNFIWLCNDTDCFALLFNYTTLQYKLVFLTSDKANLNDVMMANDYQTGIRVIASMTGKISFWIGDSTSLDFKAW